MICDVCGKQYYDDAAYCPNCGSKISNGTEKRGHEFSAPLMVVYPVIIPLKIFLPGPV